MNLYNFDRPLGGAAVTDDFMNKKLHIVCVAINSLTFYNAFATMQGGITNQQAGELAKTVNSKNETGTLWPKLSLSIIPLSQFEGRDDLGNREIMRKHIKDALLAQSKYVKSPELLFAFEGRGDFDNELAMEILEEEAAQFECNHTRAIYYIPR